MTPPTDPAQHGTLVARVFIEGTLEDVWHEITKTDELQGAFFNARMHTPGLVPGAPLQMRSSNGKYVLVVGEVLEWDPPRRFSHTFRFTSSDDPPCRVVYDLEEVEGGVQFTLTTEDVLKGSKTEEQMRSGGETIVTTLKTIVETGRPSAGTRFLYAMMGMMTFVLPKRCRVENWPLGGA